MAYRLGVVMDPIEGITPYKDTTLSMLLEAQRRGWEIRYLTLADLSLRDGIAYGNGARLAVRDDNHDWFTLDEREDEPLANLDAILMRKDPPVDSAYVYATHILEVAERAGALVVNRPSGLRDVQEKLAIAHFPQCCTPTVVEMQAEPLKAFINAQERAVLKPLHGMGGEAIFVVYAGDPNTSVIIEQLSERGTRYVMAQRYLPEISDGDRRILVIDGEPAPFALARMPAAGESRGNLAAGGRGVASPLTEREQWIVEQVKPLLAEHGILFAGLDVIGGYLTEVNVTSPTCVREIDAQQGTNLSGDLFAAIERRLVGHRR
ncbi:glutathione synthase [Spiribacter salinus M19-40]|uniref:Glutathione synthetase n=2 Tax=Spiribacter salinus TaxID=1335746 RepID=R4VIK0_9GAMM|nr:glutathione synthase [Spiribacter salinus]AGM40427.1 glutathione synthase [Spiribacter salinus M19-40]TQE99755.1 MAG: glutathione synthase [Spiribacter salinus]